VSGALPHGVRLRGLVPHDDERGTLTELFRQEWKGGAVPVQWNLVRSEAGVQRGVHVHLGYDEVYLLLDGRLVVGMRDTRRGSPTEGAVATLDLRAEAPCAVMVPTGIAHGLLFPEASRILIGTTRTWDPAQELGCHWLDPALAIPWPTRRARLSARDAAFGPLADVATRIPPWTQGARPA
jgi:dTDP-4-dehydrorhamnose 3,5-epimerase